MEGVDYNKMDSVMGKVSNTWWMTHSSCQFIISCFVHKDNKDIFTNAADLPSGKTRESARKDKSESLVEAHAAAKVNYPVTYGDVEYQMKKARVDKMASQIDSRGSGTKNVIFQMALTSFLSVLTCSSRCQYDILKV